MSNTIRLLPIAVIFIILTFFMTLSAQSANPPPRQMPPQKPAQVPVQGQALPGMNSSGQKQGPVAANSGQRFITIDFDNVDINLFIKYISELTGKNFVVDKSVQGTVTIISPTKISEEQAYNVFESVLEVHGFTTVQSGSVIKILPSARARSQNLEMLSQGRTDTPEDRVITQLVPLRFSSPEEMKKVLTPLVSQASVLISHEPSGMLIITETQSNIQKLLKIIEVLDVESREDEAAVIYLENASASTLGKILSTIYQNAGSQKKGEAKLTEGTIKIVPYERVNALIVLANSMDIGRVRNLIKMLDTEVERAEGNIHVYYLQNATASELAKVLNDLPEKSAQDAENKGKAAAISKNVRIMADEETNSLVITATKDEYAVLEGVIAKLDIPRRMVYLEALIMEVDADKSFDVGVEWAAGGSFSDSTGTLVSGFAGSDGFGLLSGLSSSSPDLPSGYSLGILKQGIRIGGITFPNIGAILNAYKTDSDINIISTPQILTTDNKQAEISVGENVPYITSRNTSSSDQDYTQYEYKDVATKLSIVPHINQADTLRLEIETEVVRIKGNDSDTPTTYKRTATTTVILNDRDTVVIGGIIGQDKTESEYKVPVLGDVPVLGWLFKTHNSRQTKTNMFIFITPRIVRNPVDMATVSIGRQDAMGEVMPDLMKEQDNKPNPEQAMKLSSRGYEKLMAGKLNEAKQYFEEALRIDATNPYALMNMGVVLEKEGNMQAAAQMYQAVISVNSNALAEESSDPDRQGESLMVLARDNLVRLQEEIAKQATRQLPPQPTEPEIPQTK